MNIISFRDSESKDAIRMRKNRAKETTEESSIRKKKNNEATKQALANESEAQTRERLAKAREYKDKNKKAETDEQKKARNAIEAANRKARRHAQKQAKSIITLHDVTENRWSCRYSLTQVVVFVDTFPLAIVSNCKCCSSTARF